MKARFIGSCLLLVALSGCTRDRSRIVKLAEDSGAGPLDGVGLLAMRRWLVSHSPIATKVDALCARLRPNATAGWPQTTEGRLCLAARTVVVQIEAERQSRERPDHTGFLPGWR